MITAANIIGSAKTEATRQKRAEQFAQALINEKEVVLKTALRQCMAKIKNPQETH